MPKSRWRIIPTANPSQVSFGVILPQDEVSNNPEAIPVPGAEYKTLGITGSITGQSLGWIPDGAMASDDRYGLYIYTYMEKENDNLIFYYAKPLTEIQANTPFRVLTAEFGDHHWPAILKALTLQEDPVLVYATPSINGNMQGITTAPRYYQQEEYINPVDEGTRFVLYEFFGPRPFVIPRYAVPQPGRIAYQTATREGSFPECLHDDVEIPGTRTANFTNAGGTTTPVGGSLDGQSFPRTNFRSWRPYVKKSGQKQQDGGWYKYLIRVFPPRIPRRIRQNS